MGTAPLGVPPAFGDVALESDSVPAGEWTLKPPSGPATLAPPARDSSANFFSVPDDPPPPPEAPPALPDPGEMILPSVPAFDAPPATWGARALAALGGQAGIAPSSDDPASGMSLFDELQAEGLQPDLPDPVASFGGGDRPLVVDQLVSPTPAPAESYPMEVIPGQAAQASEVEILLSDLPAPPSGEPPRGDALLEDELVDSPDGGRATSSWPPPETSGAFGLPLSVADAIGDPPAPEAVAYAEDATPSFEAVAFAEEDTQSAVKADAYLDDGAKPVAAPSYFDDSAEPLPEPAIAALPAANVSRIPPPVPPAAGPPSGAPTSKRPPPSHTPVPGWARSPDERTAKPRNRRLIWVIAGSVLGVSVLAGGLAGFFVGARSKPWGAWLGGGHPSALSKPKPAAADPGADDDTPEAAQPASNAAKVVPPAVGTRRPAVEAAPSVAKNAGGDTAEKRAKATAPATSEKKAPGSAAPAAWAKGVSDSAGAGQLVSVSVTSQPVGASVWINGKERGRTPLQAKIQSGPAQVVFVLAGHVSAVVDAKASEGVQVTKELVAVDPPLTGESRFRAECTTQGKFPIVVDGKETGVLCPFSKLRVDPGVHRIGLFVPALGKVREKEVTLQPGVRSIVFGD